MESVKRTNEIICVDVVRDSAVRFTDLEFILNRDPTDESVGYCH